MADLVYKLTVNGNKLNGKWTEHSSVAGASMQGTGLVWDWDIKGSVCGSVYANLLPFLCMDAGFGWICLRLAKLFWKLGNVWCNKE